MVAMNILVHLLLFIYQGLSMVINREIELINHQVCASFFTFIEQTVFQSSNICSCLQSLSNWESLHIVIQIFSVGYNLIIPSPFGGRGYPGLVAMGTHWVDHSGSHFPVKRRWGSVTGPAPGIPPITLFYPSSAVSDLNEKLTESETLASVKSPSMVGKDVVVM